MKKLNRLAATALVAAGGIASFPPKTASPELDAPPPMEWVCTQEDIPRVERAKNVIRKLFKREQYQKINCRWEEEKIYSQQEARVVIARFSALNDRVKNTQLGVFDTTKTPTEICVFNRAWMRTHDKDIAKIWKYLIERRTSWSQDIVVKIKQLVELGKGVPGSPNDEDELIRLITQKIPGAKRSACGLVFAALAAPFSHRLATGQGLGEGLLKDAYSAIGSSLNAKQPTNADIVAAQAFLTAFDGALRIRAEDMREKQ